MKMIFSFLTLFCCITVTVRSQNTFPPSGNVGIGTSTPGLPLEVKSSSLAPSIRISSPTAVYDRNNGAAIEFNSNVGLAKIIGVDERANDLSAYSGGLLFKLRQHTDGPDNGYYERMRITSDGKVGIGTSYPTNTFHVNGTMKLVGLSQLPLNATNSNMLNYANQYDFKLSSSVNGFFITVSNGFNDRKVYLQSGHQDPDFAGATGSIFLNPFGGRVGIGTTSVDAQLTVKGDVHAEEVRVDLTVPGPDYVFEEDYDLPKLESLKEYVQENKHLPEVPSASEMEAEGIDLGVMNMLLLKKVEELTLYLIEQNQQMEQLRKEFETFKSQKQ